MRRLRITTVAATLAVGAGTVTGAALAVAVTAGPADGGTVPACQTSQLKLSLGTLSPGLSHAGVIIRFRDQGAPCTLSGYPGVDGLNAAGKVTESATRSKVGYLASVKKITTVTLARTAPASAAAEGLAINAAGSSCTAFTTLEVTPPNTRTSVRFKGVQALCGLQVHPVVPGLTGTLPATR